MTIQPATTITNLSASNAAADFYETETMLLDLRVGHPVDLRTETKKNPSLSELSFKIGLEKRFSNQSKAH